MIENCLKKIANTIVCNLDNTTQLGISQGKMGLCYYLFAYSNRYNSSSHNEVACGLLREIIVEMSRDINRFSTDTMCEIGIGLVALINRGYVEDVEGQGFLEIIDKYVLGRPLTVEEMNQKSERCDVFLTGMYAYVRLKNSDNVSKRKNYDDFIGNICEELNKATRISLSEETKPFWSSVLYVLTKIDMLGNDMDCSRELRRVCQKMKMDIEIMGGIPCVPFEDKLSMRDIEMNGWKYVLYGKDKARQYFLQNDFEKYIGETVGNTYYSLMTVNSSLAAMGIMLMKEDYISIS